MRKLPHSLRAGLCLCGASGEGHRRCVKCRNRARWSRRKSGSAFDIDEL